MAIIEPLMTGARQMTFSPNTRSYKYSRLRQNHKLCIEREFKTSLMIIQVLRVVMYIKVRETAVSVVPEIIFNKCMREHIYAGSYHKY